MEARELQIWRSDACQLLAAIRSEIGDMILALNSEPSRALVSELPWERNPIEPPPKGPAVTTVRSAGQGASLSSEDDLSVRLENLKRLLTTQLDRTSVVHDDSDNDERRADRTTTVPGSFV